MAEALGGDAVVEERGRVRDPDGSAGQAEERLVQLSRVIERKHAAANLVDLRTAEDHRVRQRHRQILVVALQRERRRQAERIRERVVARKLRVVRRRADAVVRRDLAVESERDLILSELGRHHVALTDHRVVAHRRPGVDISPDNRAARARRRNDEVTGDRIAQVEQRHRNIRDAGGVGRAGALRLRNRGQNARVQRGERGEQVFLGARAADRLQRLRQHGDAARRGDKARFRVDPIVAGEKEHPVPAERPANGEPAFTPAGLRLGDPVLDVEEVVLVHLLVLEVPEGAALEQVGAVARDELEIAAAGSAHRRVIGAGLELDLFQRVRRWRDVVAERPFVGRQVRRVDPVEEQARAGGARAVHGRRDVAGPIGQDRR
jgi:hypothetical protein